MRLKSTTNNRLIVFIIINSIPPYAYETNNILALPNDTLYRARFRKKWCPEIPDANAIQNREGVIVFRNWDTAQMIPLRLIKTTTVEPVGDVYYIKYLLRDIVDYDSDEGIRTEQIADFNQQIASHLKGYDNMPQTNLQKLVFLAPDLTATISDSRSQAVNLSNRDFDNWGKVVSLMRDISCFRNIDFIKVGRILNQHGRSCVFTDRPNPKRYKLITDETYLLEIFQQCYRPRVQGDSSISLRYIVLSAEPDAIRLVKNKFAVAGLYDRYEFRFRTEVLHRIRDTDLILDIQHRNDVNIPSVFVPVRIVTPTSKLVYRAIAIVLFILGTLFLFFADKLFSQNIDTGRNIGVLIMILTGIEMRNSVVEMLNRLRLISARD